MTLIKIKLYTNIINLARSLHAEPLLLLISVSRAAGGAGLNLKGTKIEATQKQIETGVETVLAIAEVIKGLGSVPSGNLYTRVMGFLSLDEYNQIIGILKKQRLIEESYHELKWIA